MSQFFAEAEVLIRPSTIGFSAALVEKVNAEILAAQAAIKPIVVGASVVPAGAATGAAKTASAETAALNGANLALAGSTARTTEEITKQGAAVQKTTSALSKSSAELAAATRHQEQFARGLGTAGLSFLGLRAQVLAASAAFVAGAAGALIARRSIAAASDQIEQTNKAVEVFGKSAKGIEDWSKTTASAMGISETAALAASSSYGQLFRTLGVGPEKAAGLSESLVKLASDLASFSNVSTERALAAIFSGLVGQARPLRALGVFLTAARVKQEALIETGKKHAAALTQQDIILARYNLILRDSAIAQGDFQRTQDRLANQSRILQAHISNLAADIGRKLLPVLTRAIRDANDAATALEKLGNVKIKTPDIPLVGGGGESRLADLAKTFAENVGKSAILNFPAVGQGIQLIIGSEKLLQRATEDTTKATRDQQEAAVENARALRGMQGVLSGVAAAAAEAARQLRGLQHGADVLTQQIEQIQAGVLPGGRPAEESALVKAIAQQQAIIDQQTRAGGVGSKAYRDALRKKKQLMDQLASLQAQDAADAQAAAQKIRTAREKADQAIQDAITAATGRADLRKAIAAGTAQTLDDLTAAIHERAVIRQLIRTLVPRIKDEQTRAAVLAQLRAAEVQANNEVKALQEERRKARVAARQAAIDARETHLRAMLSIAETTATSKDDLTALRALQAFYQRRIAELKKIKHRNQEQNAALDAYRVSLAQTNESIRNITKEAQKGNTFAQQAFAFLQTQQGFVSNLLGNLIPGGLTSGLVGGQPGVPSNAPRQVAGGFEQPRGVNFTAGEAVRTRPVSSGQANTQISLLRDVRDLLRQILRGTEHPEAKGQRAKGSSAMDFHIQGTYGM